MEAINFYHHLVHVHPLMAVGFNRSVDDLIHPAVRAALRVYASQMPRFMDTASISARTTLAFDERQHLAVFCLSSGAESDPKQPFSPGLFSTRRGRWKGAARRQAHSIFSNHRCSRVLIKVRFAPFPRGLFFLPRFRVCLDYSQSRLAHGLVILLWLG